MATIESIKALAEDLCKEVDEFLDACENDPTLCEDETHDELVEVSEIVGGWLWGEDGAPGEAPE